VAKHNFASIRVLQKCGFRLAREDMCDGDDGEELVRMPSSRLDVGPLETSGEKKRCTGKKGKPQRTAPPPRALPPVPSC
jgi:hypothetical protein